MRKTLTSVGNSLGVIIDKPSLELLNIDRDTPLEISTDGKQLVIRPIRAEPRASRVRTSAKRMTDAHDATMRKLAR